MGLDGTAIAQIQNYRQQAASLLLYQSVFSSDIGKALLKLLTALTAGDAITCAQAYGQWFSALAVSKHGWQYHLINQILESDNSFAQQAQAIPALPKAAMPTASHLAEYIAPGILSAIHHDLAILHRFYHLPVEQLSQWVQALCDGAPPPVMQPLSEAKLPVSFPYEPEWVAAPQSLAAYYRSHGVGIFGQFLAFRWQSDATAGKSQLIGIRTPDPVQLSGLVAYDHPKQQLIQNTQALLNGYTAQNVLLYGSRGAGKSSLVKALLNEYHTQGLRLIEVPKAHLHNLPQIIEPLSRVPQKFIIFVDDLSFEEDDEAFKALKVVLEGGVTARPQNVVVYATSNRRHLVREFFDERPRPKDADEIQAWDTVQEKLSFSDRFGLTLTFTPADQSTYLTIVRQLAQQANLTIEAEHLDWRARQWATRHNGRSGRTARQFVDFLIAEQGATQASAASQNTPLPASDD
ncbi:MAG: ATP-binding protein [Cyanobacteria bacterium J06554_3]